MIRSRAVAITLTMAALVGPGPGEAQERVDPAPEFAEVLVAMDAGPPAVETVPFPPQTRGFPMRGDRFGTFLGAVAGLVVGGTLGYAVPGVFVQDACSETCAGMWVSIPAGMILGSALGAVALGDAEWVPALGGSALGLLAGIAVQILVNDTRSDGRANAGGVLGIVAHGVITTMVIERSR